MVTPTTQQTRRVEFFEEKNLQMSPLQQHGHKHWGESSVV